MSNHRCKVCAVIEVEKKSHTCHLCVKIAQCKKVMEVYAAKNPIHQAAKTDLHNAKAKIRHYRIKLLKDIWLRREQRWLEEQKVCASILAIQTPLSARA